MERRERRHIRGKGALGRGVLSIALGVMASKTRAEEPTGPVEAPALSIVNRVSEGATGYRPGDAVRPRRDDGVPPSIADQEAPRARATYTGRPEMGQEVVLHGEGSAGARLHYRWVQTRGVSVSWRGPTNEATARFTVPPGAEPLGFVLFVANPAGVDSATLTIPLGTATEASAPEPSSRGIGPEMVRADAGDDQIGLVGRQVTLNAGRSEPKGQLAYRWLPVGGPPIRLKLEDGPYYSFVPEEPGLYRFALVVAARGTLSQPDIVEIQIQEPASTPSPAAPPSLTGPTPPAQAVPAVPIDALARIALQSVPDGPSAASSLADCFDRVGQRMELYGSYAEAHQELARQLETIVPTDPARRRAWTDTLFGPLTGRLIETMQSEGLDLGRPDGLSRPLTHRQKARLSELFRSMAAGARAAGAGNGG